MRMWTWPRLVRHGLRHPTVAFATAATLSLSGGWIEPAAAAPPPPPGRACEAYNSSRCVGFDGFPLSHVNSGSIAAGPDDRLWFTENAGVAKGLGAITTSGQITEYTIPTLGSHPGSIARGPDGRMWFTEDLTNKIGAVTTTGQFSEFPVPTPMSGGYSIAAGPDGRLWFTEFTAGKVAAITTAGQITEYPLPNPGSEPISIAAGPDGRMWFAEYGASTVGAITTSGQIAEYPQPPAQLRGIAAGPDGRLWFTDANGRIDAITTSGQVSGWSVQAAPANIARGSDGRMWFTQGGDSQVIGAINTNGASTLYLTPGATFLGIASGPDGRIWMTQGYPYDAVAALGGSPTPLPPNPRRPAPSCTVPPLGGLTLGQARKRLVAAHCRLGKVARRKAHNRPGRVLVQRPAAGKRTPVGTKVSVTVSSRS